MTMGRLLLWITRTGAVVVCLLAVLLALRQRELEWEETILPMARRYAGISNDTTHDGSTGANSATPLEGTTILITGATSGIGLALTRALSKLGGTVVALGRSPSKLARLRDEIPSLRTFAVDLADLAAVSRTANEVILPSSGIERIDILINNAGMHATGDMFAKYASVGQNPAYDRVFVVNYLSHFLLTEKLMPLLQKSVRQPVIVQTSSSFHWAVDSTDLLVTAAADLPPAEAVAVEKNMPVAARPGGSHGFYVFRTQRSYANSKLAQIYHARLLQTKFPDFRVVSFCPGWVATNIAGPDDSVYTALLARVAFPMEGWGIASGLSAIFGNNNEKDGDYYVNSKVFQIAEYIFPNETPGWMYQTGIRDMIGLVFAMMIGLWTQNLAPHVGPSRSSPESYNLTTATVLYEWSHSAVAEYL